jgi:hypothetical protein
MAEATPPVAAASSFPPNYGKQKNKVLKAQIDELIKVVAAHENNILWLKQKMNDVYVQLATDRKVAGQQIEFTLSLRDLAYTYGENIRAILPEAPPAAKKDESAPKESEPSQVAPAPAVEPAIPQA